MKQATKKQVRARARNWNKRLIKSMAYSLRVMTSNPRMSNGLTARETQELYWVSRKLFAILKNWKRSIN